MAGTTMSMNLVLERIAVDSAVAESNQQAVAKMHQPAGPLRIFTADDDSWEETRDDSPIKSSTKESGITSSIGKIAQFFGGSEDFRQPGAGDSLFLEKAWHGLHYLLAGEAWGGKGELAFLLSGGVETGDDFGYGPARYFEPSEVNKIATLISTIDDAQLWSRYDPQHMTDQGVYPDIWDEPEQDLHEEYLDYFNLLKEFLAEAAAAGDAMEISMQ